MGRSCVWAVGSCSQAGVPETDYCTERKQSLESFTKKEFIAARESSMMEPIGDRRPLPPYPVRGRVRDSRSSRSSHRLGVDQVCAPKRTRARCVRNVGQNLVPATFGFPVSRQNGWCSQSRQRGGAHPSAQRRSGTSDPPRRTQRQGEPYDHQAVVHPTRPEPGHPRRSRDRDHREVLADRSAQAHAHEQPRPRGRRAPRRPRRLRRHRPRRPVLGGLRRDRGHPRRPRGRRDPAHPVRQARRSHAHPRVGPARAHRQLQPRR
jgi:hypothetical protein